jgi:integrase
VSEISEQKVARFQARVACEVSATRTNNIMNLVRFIMSACERRDLIDRDPTINVAKLAFAPPTIYPFTKDKLDLIQSNTDPHYRRLFICLAWTGARSNELCAVRWRDIDFRRNEIRITKGRYRGVEELPKTRASSRIVPMFSIVRETLLALIDTNMVAMMNTYSRPKQDWR